MNDEFISHNSYNYPPKLEEPQSRPNFYPSTSPCSYCGIFVHRKFWSFFFWNFFFCLDAMDCPYLPCVMADLTAAKSAGAVHVEYISLHFNRLTTIIFKWSAKQSSCPGVGAELSSIISENSKKSGHPRETNKLNWRPTRVVGPKSRSIPGKQDDLQSRVKT